MLPKDVKSAVRAIVRLVQARFHQEGDAAQQRRYAAPDKGTPHVGGISRFKVHDSCHCLLAARAREGRWVVVSVHTQLRRKYLTGDVFWTMIGGGGGCMW